MRLIQPRPRLSQHHIASRDACHPISRTNLGIGRILSTSAHFPDRIPCQLGAALSFAAGDGAVNNAVVPVLFGGGPAQMSRVNTFAISAPVRSLVSRRRRSAVNQFANVPMGVDGFPIDAAPRIAAPSKAKRPNEALVAPMAQRHCLYEVLRGSVYDPLPRRGQRGVALPAGIMKEAKSPRSLRLVAAFNAARLARLRFKLICRRAVVLPAKIVRAAKATRLVQLAATLDRAYSFGSHALNLLRSALVRTRHGVSAPGGFAVCTPLVVGVQ